MFGVRIEYIESGDIGLDPDELAREFQLSADTLRRYLRMGLVASTVERGEDCDLGKTRVTVRVGNRIWQAVVEHGDIVHQERRVLRAVTPLRSTP
ncbi:DUF6522 family protein [Pseudorhizobium endolithicum]|uniref:DUF6522 family protein n=1 Tax=Pseudorhizobium endolithicum TaxID=1191678 RepID=UPI001F33FB69|nr:DUF6522 family protein [Pseudorhizobium endolithicum]